MFLVDIFVSHNELIFVVNRLLHNFKKFWELSVLPLFIVNNKKSVTLMENITEGYNLFWTPPLLKKTVSVTQMI